MKYLSVVLITLIVIGITSVVAGFYYWIFTLVQLPLWVRLVILLISAGMIIAMAAVGFSRIKEIRQEEKDDLSKY